VAPSWVKRSHHMETEQPMDATTPLLELEPPNALAHLPSPRPIAKLGELSPRAPSPRGRSSSLPCSRSPYLPTRATDRRASLPASALPTRSGTPAWTRPSSEFGKRTAKRSHQLPPLYLGKGQYGPSPGPSDYDVQGCSRTGSRFGSDTSAPTFGIGSRTDRDTCYEGKENEATMFGSYGPGFYDVKLSPINGAPKFGSGARFAKENTYEGKEITSTMLGRYGPGMYDVKPAPVKGTPKFHKSVRFDRESAYEGKAATSACKRGQFGPGMYDVRCSNTGSLLLHKGRGPSAAFALPYRAAPRPHAFNGGKAAPDGSVSAPPLRRGAIAEPEPEPEPCSVSAPKLRPPHRLPPCDPPAASCW